MPERERDADGKFTGGADPDTVYDALEPLEPYTTGEVADLVGVPRRTVYNYLEELADQGRIRKKKPEERRAIWIKESSH